jgi:hypothetical protein
MSGITRDDWLQALHEAGVVTESDDTAITLAEFADMTGLKHATAHARLQLLVETGKAIQTHKLTRTRGGKMVMHKAYRLATPRKKR